MCAAEAHRKMLQVHNVQRKIRCAASSCLLLLLRQPELTQAAVVDCCAFACDAACAASQYLLLLPQQEQQAINLAAHQLPLRMTHARFSDRVLLCYTFIAMCCPVPGVSNSRHAMLLLTSRGAPGAAQHVWFDVVHQHDSCARRAAAL